MPKLYNPDTQAVVEAKGKDLQNLKRQGYIVVGNRSEAKYMGKTREELKDVEDEDVTETE